MIVGTGDHAFGSAIHARPARLTSHSRYRIRCPLLSFCGRSRSKLPKIAATFVTVHRLAIFVDVFQNLENFLGHAGRRLFCHKRFSWRSRLDYGLCGNPSPESRASGWEQEANSFQPQQVAARLPRVKCVERVQLLPRPPRGKGTR